MIEQLTDYLNNSVNDLHTILPEAGFEIAYGDTYSLTEIRKAVCTDKLPVFAQLSDGKLVLFVGENKQNQLVIQDKHGNYFNSDDKVLNKAWTGNVVIVTNKNELEPSKNIKLDEEPDSIVLFNSMLNTWDEELNDRRHQSMKLMEQIKYLDEHYLPEHPVIVYFKKASEQESKEGVRSYTKGVEVCIIDPSDPFTEFLHEFGHVYWSSRLDKEDKDKLKELHSKLDKDKLPPVLMDNWSWKTPEELFATIYLWYVKGVHTNPGYLKILCVTYNEAKECIESIFNRVRADIANKKALQGYNQTIEKAWKDNERNVVISLKQLMGQPVTLKVSGELIKAKNLPNIDIFDTLIVPSSIQTTVLGEHKNHKWHYIHSGLLKGYTIVTNLKDVVDFNFMKSKQKFYLVPKYVLMKANGKSFKSVRYFKPADILEGLEVNREIEQPLQKLQTESGFFKSIWKSLRGESGP